MLKILTATACFTATVASADPMNGLQNHDVQKWFIQEPCTKVIETIDMPDDEASEALGNSLHAFTTGTIFGFSEDQLTLALQPVTNVMVQAGFSGMAFGFLMGFETQHPGIRGDHETVLMRLRSDCAADPTKTAIEYLTIYARE